MLNKSLPRLLPILLLTFVVMGATAMAAEPAHPPAPEGITSLSFPVSILMLVMVFVGFVCMTVFNVPIPLAMGLLATSFLAITWGQAEKIASRGFHHLTEIALVFTAVAIPAHMIEKSRGFEWIAADLGRRFGKLRLRSPRLATPLLVAMLLGTTYVLAGLMHNITSILIMTPIIIRLCESYGVPSRWLLCGALVASNLGGFSTRWGDTPNIVEARYWKLNAMDFCREIVPPNLIVIAVLIMVVHFLTQRELSRNLTSATATRESLGGPRPGHTLQTALGAAGWEMEQKSILVDKRLIIIGMVGLVGFIVSHVIWNHLSIALGALTIFLCVLFQRRKDRLDTLTSLGFEVYLTFASIFMIAGCIKHSWIGDTLQAQIEALNFSPWIISVTAYLGTTFTEAGSWVNAVAEPISQGDPSHTTAWALGAGICAGSSSILTSASAGIILWEQSARFKEHAIGFKNYLFFGLGFSLFMLAFYCAYFTFVFKP